MLKRFVNVGFSGGEKKRFEILQMALLDPKIAVLDETDSGLDVDALRIVGKGVTNLKSKDRGMLVITHYQRLLDHIIPDFVHIMVKGKIIKSGGPDLAKLVEKEGYKSFLNEINSPPSNEVLDFCNSFKQSFKEHGWPNSKIETWKMTPLQKFIKILKFKT